MVVLHPTMNLIIVEGGTHSIASYKKLMLNRIKWSENERPLSNANPTTFTGGGGAGRAAASGDPGAQMKTAYWCSPFVEDGDLKDLSENRCVLVWEGDEAARSFKRWGSRVAETDGEAKDILGRQKMENMWTLARSK
jgi:U4/U6 small nuclear ribonucleoprotein PRP3